MLMFNGNCVSRLALHWVNCLKALKNRGMPARERELPEARQGCCVTAALAEIEHTVQKSTS